MSLSRRFGVSEDYDQQKKEGLSVANVTDCGNVVFTTEPIKLPSTRDSRYYEITGEVKNKAVEWLDLQYPDWKNPGAYWD